MNIPVVDFGACSLDVEDITRADLHKLSTELENAFTQVGFVFLQNTGITQEEVDGVMNASMRFFLQPDDLKQPFRRKTYPNCVVHGWLPLGTERVDPNKPEDLKESFNLTSLNPDIKWSTSVGFRETQAVFFQRCKELSLRILKVIAHSLDVDPDIFLSAHRHIENDENLTTMRSLYYPPVKRELAKEGQLRCGQHSDYGSITLLFQQSQGLQVRGRSGEFILVPCIPGAVLLNIADMMQRWTSDRFVSAVHRVLLPSADDSSPRQSLVFFLMPDDDAVISCLDGSNKYPPVRAGDYFAERFSYLYVNDDLPCRIGSQ
ncbi:uncharacterized protein si:dkey-10o6.2 isoform X1 [Phyllopteryx taeniolatus]|uniref:uncharacterized protein si:dkey-10o6.2 isoform X1 n=2 Tax=Phyllopteryx taeniolatus TaxID=161469 RepID=UPI002AD41A0D|nr:uncharacterized protein si:dkey-10o6.2 isoform X1 [Phyllopteryx taeniolatus]XP_061630085.1 uncharacterized protein si:dkey-10o6.2 isoform X1 [Phyllopteryx taeniolatus]XP_061630086.1 uncharacterized protein si:dkey-10o6.2 isoform X1 [Phyllopteryx taeniolatus]XP_061630087.1 uncharacterized protein si:dkey-10o6.2 isoform X1 [Phyllopteryx taeniolatus]XP_061630089.1 uncharacterized protein si:dkey-10o6.2 isoform X1 [Phyllopteryx taeniolatus]